MLIKKSTHFPEIKWTYNNTSDIHFVQRNVSSVHPLACIYWKNKAESWQESTYVR